MTRLLTVLAILGSLAADAQAITIYKDLKPKMGEIDVPVHSSKSLVIKMPVAIDRWTAGNRVDYDIKESERVIRPGV